MAIYPFLISRRPFLLDSFLSIIPLSFNLLIILMTADLCLLVFIANSLVATFAFSAIESHMFFYIGEFCSLAFLIELAFVKWDGHGYCRRAETIGFYAVLLYDFRCAVPGLLDDMALKEDFC